ncbi:MAG: HU family DNA-binding protein [Planctomycetes bacterium]|nr:HU family DNA-binding protein [Planctomycetota bacterium]
MNRADIVDYLVKSKVKGLESKASAERAVEAVLAAVRIGLKKGSKKVSLIGFGAFSVVKRKGRIGRNPQTGGAIKIPPRNTVTFKVSKTLKDALK